MQRKEHNPRNPAKTPPRPKLTIDHELLDDVCELFPFGESFEIELGFHTFCRWLEQPTDERLPN